eukprot:scaffold17501_cov140-Amphora_coffeaeformis.AAC.3
MQSSQHHDRTISSVLRSALSPEKDQERERKKNIAAFGTIHYYHTTRQIYSTSWHDKTLPVMRLIGVFVIIIIYTPRFARTTASYTAANKAGATSTPAPPWDNSNTRKTTMMDPQEIIGATGAAGIVIVPGIVPLAYLETDGPWKGSVTRTRAYPSGTRIVQPRQILTITTRTHHHHHHHIPCVCKNLAIQIVPSHDTATPTPLVAQSFLSTPVPTTAMTSCAYPSGVSSPQIPLLLLSGMTMMVMMVMMVIVLQMATIHPIILQRWFSTLSECQAKNVSSVGYFPAPVNHCFLGVAIPTVQDVATTPTVSSPSDSSVMPDDGEEAPPSTTTTTTTLSPSVVATQVEPTTAPSNTASAGAPAGVFLAGVLLVSTLFFPWLHDIHLPVITACLID